MKLYEVHNGWMGESYVRVVVVAPDDNTALELARKKFDQHPKYAGEQSRLEMICVRDDLSEPWCSEPSDSGIEKPEGKQS